MGSGASKKKAYAAGGKDAVDWGTVPAKMEAFEIQHNWVCPDGWLPGIRAANAGADKDKALDALIDAAEPGWKALDEKLGKWAKLGRPFMKLRAMANNNNDPAAAAESMITALKSGKVEDEIRGGLLPGPPADPSALPEAFADVKLEPGEHRGKLMADGGNMVDTNLEAYGKLVEMSGGADKAVIGICCVAACNISEDAEAEWMDHQLPHNKFEKAAASFGLCGVPLSRVLLVPISLKNMEEARDSDECASVIRKCTCLWMPGGEHYRVIQCLFGHTAEGARKPPSKVFNAIQEQYRKGMAIGSTSSGAFIITRGPLVTGGSDLTRCLTERPVVNNKGLLPESTYDADGGLALIESEGSWGNALVDAHCPEKVRLLRLIRLISFTQAEALGTKFGIGIGENTQLVIDRATDWAEVLGNSCVQLVDVSSATYPNGEQGEPFAVDGVVLHQLSRGDKFNLKSGEIVVADWKPKVTEPRSSEAPFVSTDIFSEPKSLSKAVVELGLAAAAESVCSSAGATAFKVTLAKTEQTAAFVGNEPMKTKHAYAGEWAAVQSLRLSVAPAA